MNSMDWVLVFGITSYVIGPCLSVNCFMKADGIYEENCRAYTKCVDMEAVIVNCQYGQAFNTETKVCENKWKVPPPCGTYRDCQYQADGFYADMETKCASYYTCQAGIFYGHTLCPGGLVYNAGQNVCDYVYNVPPPCGTLTGSINTTASTTVRPIVASTLTVNDNTTST